MSEFRIGTSAFTATGWEGSFYPAGMKPAEYLTYYATKFNTVEIDSTFYRTPALKTVKGWAEKVPKGFVIAAKVPQICCGPSYVVLIFDRLVSRGLGVEQRHITSSRHWKPCHVGGLANASRLGPRQRAPRATSRLQTAKELHQVGIIPPFQSGVGWLDPWIAGGECLRFHCQVGFSIDISCVHRDVAQPCADRIDVHA
jgi:hypothetical protein